MVERLSSIFLRRSSPSLISMMRTSSRLPVASLRYLEMKGTVAPSSRRPATAATEAAFSPVSAASLPMWPFMREPFGLPTSLIGAESPGSAPDFREGLVYGIPDLGHGLRREGLERGKGDPLITYDGLVELDTYLGVHFDDIILHLLSLCGIF